MKLRGWFIAPPLAAAAFCLGASSTVQPTYVNWTAYYGSAGNDHSSSLAQINRHNVGALKEIWRYDTGETGGLETTPLVVDGVLYGLTPSQKVIALDARNGKLLWTFDSKVKATGPNRGLTYRSDGQEKCLFAGIMNFLYAIDPRTGQPIARFGQNGRVDLREGLGRDPALQSISLTSPGVIYKDLIIVGGRVPETLPAPPGDIRAYDVHTGRLHWTFHTIPHPGEFGYETWPMGAWKKAGSANNWAGMAVDSEHGIVFVPTGSAVPDFYGGGRTGDDLFADSLIALNAETGERIWHFQGVHHDIWDRDFAAPPSLLTVRRDGRQIPAVVESSKQGLLFVFNRLTGEPLFPMEERRVAASSVTGEQAAATQPFPLMPAPFARQEIIETTLTTRTPEAHRWAVEQFRKMRHVFPYKPLSLGVDTLVMPSFEGGGEWGGVAVDPSSGVIYINANDYASFSSLEAHQRSGSGRSIYLSQCSECHGPNREGSPPSFPSLLESGKKYSEAEIAAIVHQGRGRMPSFPNLQGAEIDRLIAFVRSGLDAPGSENAADGTEYNLTGYRRFLDPDGYPAVEPPWGTMSAIDLNTGRYLWKEPLGEYPALSAQHIAPTGTENYGGPLVTAGGIVWIAATNFDRKFRALAADTGKLLWETTLPFPGNATPATYAIDGRQYVVIAAGGTSLMVAKGSLGGVYVAYALPEPIGKGR